MGCLRVGRFRVKGSVFSFISCPTSLDENPMRIARIAGLIHLGFRGLGFRAEGGLGEAGLLVMLTAGYPVCKGPDLRIPINCHPSSSRNFRMPVITRFKGEVFVVVLVYE